MQSPAMTIYNDVLDGAAGPLPGAAATVTRGLDSAWPRPRLHLGSHGANGAWPGQGPARPPDLGPGPGPTPLKRKLYVIYVIFIILMKKFVFIVMNCL